MTVKQKVENYIQTLSPNAVSSSDVYDEFLGENINTMRGVLQKLRAEGKILTPTKGYYRWAGTTVSTTESLTSLGETPRA